MLTKRSKIVYLIISLLLVAWLLIGKILASEIIVVPCMLCFLALITWCSSKGFAVPILLFFLPWSSIMKIGLVTISIYTVGIFLVLIFYLLHGLKHTNVVHIVPALALLALTMVTKTAYGFSIDNSYILLLSCLLVFPFLSKEAFNQYDFYELTLFFSCGVTIAAVAAPQLSNIPTMAQYITLSRISGMTRYSGFYGDPNFYSAQISAALAGVMLLIFRETSKRRKITLFVLALLLTYCGFLSLAKSFALIWVGVILLWLINTSFQRGRISMKLMMLLAFFVTATVLLSSSVFSALIDQVISRFISDSGNLSAFTTNRTDLWLLYMNEMIDKPLILIFGIGVSKYLLDGWASHNTIIQILFQLGLVGGALFSAWMILFARNVLGRIRIHSGNIILMLMLMVGAFGPWMALDLLFFDELFLITFYVLIGIRTVSAENACSEIN